MIRYALFAGFVLVFAATFASRAPDPGEEAKAPAAAAKHTASGRQRAGALEVPRDSSGQFHVTARVNGEDARFMVDTGADVVALTMGDAQRLGIEVEPEQFEAVGQTASGIGYGKRVRLDRVEIDGHEIADVEAVVLDGLQTNLLGQSVLRRLGQVELRGDTMVIRAAS